MITSRIQAIIAEGMTIPKPAAKAQHVVKGWGMRRSEPALIYQIPNHKSPGNSYEKGITVSEFEMAFNELYSSNEFTRAWFNKHMPACAREGSCNFTSIGGIFEILGVAEYSGQGRYRRRRPV